MDFELTYSRTIKLDAFVPEVPKLEPLPTQAWVVYDPDQDELLSIGAAKRDDLPCFPIPMEEALKFMSGQEVLMNWTAIESDGWKLVSKKGSAARVAREFARLSAEGVVSLLVIESESKVILNIAESEHSQLVKMYLTAKNDPHDIKRIITADPRSPGKNELAVDASRGLSVFALKSSTPVSISIL